MGEKYILKLCVYTFCDEERGGHHRGNILEIGKERKKKEWKIETERKREIKNGVKI